jgi:erythronate-4-phosphate dehydrogenase
MPLIIADENIPAIAEALAGIGEVRTMPGRAITAESLREADALVVRSVTKVNAALLAGSKVRLVATATTGDDHLDLAWLHSQGIAVATAAGSNARSVVEYLIAALLEVGARTGGLDGKTLGVIGHGRIGGEVARLAPLLGLEAIACDPPRQRAGHRAADGREFLPITEVLRRADIVTLHVPLVRDGEDATRGLVDEARLALLRDGAVVINTSRGDVLAGDALRRGLESGRIGGAVLDVWENEPAIDPALARLCWIATPHIAGYSTDGKFEGTRMVAAAVAAHLGRPFSWRPTLPPPHRDSLRTPESGTPEDKIRSLVHQAYDLRMDDARLRTCLHSPTLATEFDRLRKEYPIRREFRAFTLSQGYPHIWKSLSALE